jgi:hypothetical protein
LEDVSMARKINLLIIPLVFAILIIIGLIVAIVNMNSDQEKMKADKDRALEENETLASEKADLTIRLRKVKVMTLGPGEGESDPYTVITNYLTNQNASLKKYLKDVFDMDMNVTYDSFPKILEDLFAREKVLLKWGRELEAKLSAVNLRLVEAKNVYETDKVSLQEDINKEAAEKRALEGKIRQQEDAFKQQIDELETEKTKLMDEFAQFRTMHALKVAELDSRITDQLSRIHELTKKDIRTIANTNPDGEVVYSDQKLGKAWVNLGRVNGIRKGMNFQVFQVMKGGKRKPKGRVETIKIEDYITEVAIQEEKDPKDPIVPGDYIISPFYDPKETPVFVFLGDLNNRKWSKTELGRKISELGGKVENIVTVETDYVIAGRNAEEDFQADYEKAIRYGTIIMREKDLFDYLGY